MKTLSDIASCLPGYDPESMRVDVARSFMSALAQPIEETETLPIREALGRVIAEDIVSPIDVPAHDNSAMDGFALSGAELKPGQPNRFRVAGKALAGSPLATPTHSRECVRITTGAVMPAGLDTVVPQELVQLESVRAESMQQDATSSFIVVPEGAVRPGDHRRMRGEDLSRGAVALRRGRTLRPADIGLLASMGIASVPVFRRLRVAFFSTGDELRSVGADLDPGCVYDSNRYTLWSMLQGIGADAIDLGVVKDEPGALTLAFTEAAAQADAVITSGGVSVGEADHTRRVMAEVGEVHFWSVAMRPGRPFAMGRLRSGREDEHEHEPQAGSEASVGSQGEMEPGSRSGVRVARARRSTLLFGLPGNPVAVMVGFYALVRDTLLQMGGALEAPLQAIPAVSVNAIRKRPGRTEYQRAVVARGEDGLLHATVTGHQGSGVLRSMSEANALAVLVHDRGDIAAGELIDVLMFDGLL